MLHFQRTLRSMLLVVAPLFTLSCSTPGQTPTSSSQQDDMASVRMAIDAHWAAINAASSTSNPHTADITMFMPQFEGRFGENSEEMRQLIAGGKPPIPLVLRDVQIQILSNGSAVATFFQDGSFWTHDGREDRRPRRVTEVWVKLNYRWIEAHHHDSVDAPLQ